MSENITRLSSALAGRYHIEREIGSGGMATVYLARDLKHDRDVALKVLRPELAAMLGTNRFLNEIRISARLDHPHILTLIDSGVADGIPYYVLPFVRGESLRARLEREKQLSVEDALEITRQVASALDHAHHLGIVHRDIKPENILIREGEAVLSDFGIAVAVKEAGGSRLTESGVSLGTPQYMSPEQATGDRPVDGRSDVYSIGAVAYEMLAGEPPHTGGSVQAVIAKLLTEQPTRLRVLRASVPEAVDEAVSKALAKVPADRFATAGDFARALATPSASVPARLRARSRRLVTRAVSGGAVIAVAITAALALTRKPARLPQPDKVQLTVTGTSVIPALSPDGNRFAFGEKHCDESGRCRYHLVIQEIDGSGRHALMQNLTWIWGLRWTDDGRFLVFTGSYGPPGGLYAISTLGGEPRQLGYGWLGDAVSGDTLFLSPGEGGSPGGDSLAWVRLVTVHDGQTIDSLPVRDVGVFWAVIPLISNRLLVMTRKTAEGAPEYRLTDYSGRIIDRMSPGFGALGRRQRSEWAPSRQRMVIASQRARDGTEYDILSLEITPSAIAQRMDTILSGIELREGLFNVSNDGDLLVSYTGPVESELAMIAVDRTPAKPLVAKHLSSSTTLLRGRSAPATDKILLARDVPRGNRQVTQFSLMARTGGAESRIPGEVENLLDFQWSPDGAGFIYLQRIGDGKIRLMELDTTGRRPREIARLDDPAAVAFHPLRDGGVVIIPADRRSLSIIRRPGKPDTTWRYSADQMSFVSHVARSPDAKSLAVLGGAPGDSVVVATADLETGHLTRIAAVPAQLIGGLTWLNDGSIMLVVRDPEGDWVFYRIPPGQRAERVGALPFSRADFSVSNDGRYVAMFGYNDKNDVYMIRNFGKLLPR